MPISFQELLDAFDFVSMDAGLGEHQAILCWRTGKIYVHSELADMDDDPLPEGFDEDENYIAVPDKRDLDPGKLLVLSFARVFLPNDIDDVYDMFRRKGAYAKFKALLMRRNALDR